MKKFRLFSMIGAAMLTAISAVAEKLRSAVFGYMHNSGMLLAASALDDAVFAQNRVTNPAQSVVYCNKLYDYLLYPAAGLTTLTFFSLPLGQGVTSALGATVGTPKTYADTNMEMPSALPSGKRFSAQSIEVVFLPGSVPTANTYTPANLSLFAAVAVATVAGQLNDINTIYQGGWLEFNVASTNICREAGLFNFPPKFHMEIDAAVATNSATTSELAIVLGRAAGQPYYLDPPVTLEPAQNFEVKLQWPGAVATPSTFNGRIGVLLDGGFMRASS